MSRFSDSNDDPIYFDNCKVVRGTNKALLIEIEGEQKWIPKSVVHDDSEVFDDEDNREGTLVLKEWWARKEGLV